MVLPKGFTEAERIRTKVNDSSPPTTSTRNAHVRLGGVAGAGGEAKGGGKPGEHMGVHLGIDALSTVHSFWKQLSMHESPQQRREFLWEGPVARSWVAWLVHNRSNLLEIAPADVFAPCASGLEFWHTGSVGRTATCPPHP